MLCRCLYAAVLFALLAMSVIAFAMHPIAAAGCKCGPACNCKSAPGTGCLPTDAGPDVLLLRNAAGKTWVREKGTTGNPQWRALSSDEFMKNYGVFRPAK